MDFSKPDNARKVNRLKVLSLFRKEEGIGRAEIAKLIGINKVSVSEIVDSLLQEGYLYESGKEKVTKGRPKTRLSLNGEKGAVIVFSFQNKNVIALLGDLKGRIIRMEILSYGQDLGENLNSTYEKMRESTSAAILGVLISSDEAIDAELSFPYVWKRRIESLVRGEQDTFSEELEDTLFLAIGREITGEFFRNGEKIILTSIGHMRIKRGAICSKGHEGCLEGYFSLYAYEKKGKELMLEEENYLRSDEVLSYLRENLRVLSSALLTLSEVLSVKKAVLLGDGADFPDDFLLSINKMLKENSSELDVRKGDAKAKGEIGGSLDLALDEFFFKKDLLSSLSYIEGITSVSST